MNGPVVRPDKDALITEFGDRTLRERYCLDGEEPQDVFIRVATAYADDESHANRLYDYISSHWFMPATPVLSNGGTGRGLPISCYLNTVEDSLHGIAETWNENIWLGSNGGGIGTSWSSVRAVGVPVGNRGGSSGIIPFIRVMDSQTLAISQGSLRRGAGAAYLDVGHPEIEEFLEIRKPTGDYNRKALNLHHGVVVSDQFMQFVKHDKLWTLIDPHSGKATKSLPARELWQRILELRVQTGEPYILFEGNVEEGMSEVYQHRGARVQQSNLCSEIMLETTNERSAVCCLGSVNLRYFTEWQNHPLFIEDCMRFLDNVLDDFIDRAKRLKGFARTIRSAEAERSVGLGAMGFHSFLQDMMIPFESVPAKSWNRMMFKHIREKTQEANVSLAEERGPCPDAAQVGLMHRFSNTMAVAPTASISIIAGQASPCIEPWNTNAYVHKTLTGSHVVKNQALDDWIKQNWPNEYDDIWSRIVQDRGSVQNIDEFDDDTKAVFKTAWEIDQRYVIEFAADRTPFIDQGQSVNLFLPPDVDIFHLHMLHYTAWEKGLKSLYYLRSQSIQNAGADVAKTESLTLNRNDYEECLSCQ